MIVFAADPAPAPVASYAIPTHGRERILIKRVLDGETVDGYFLVPHRFKMHGIQSPKVDGPTREQGERSWSAGDRSLSALRSRLTQWQVYPADLHGPCNLEDEP